jgi:hypothetical protein
MVVFLIMTVVGVFLMIDLMHKHAQNTSRHINA